MDYSFFIALVASILAIGKFLDTYHFNNKILKYSQETTRIYLIHVFIKLDDFKLEKFAKFVLRWTFKLRWISLVSSSFFLFMTCSLIYEIFGNAPELIFYMLIGISFIFIQYILFLTIKLISLNLSEKLCTISLAFSLVIVATLANMTMLSVRDILNTSGIFASITMFLFVFSSVIPYSISFSLAVIMLVTKSALSATRFIMMHLSDVASSDKNDPFQYFSAITAILISAYELGKYALLKII